MGGLWEERSSARTLQEVRERGDGGRESIPQGEYDKPLGPILPVPHEQPLVCEYRDIRFINLLPAAWWVDAICADASGLRVCETEATSRHARKANAKHSYNAMHDTGVINPLRVVGGSPAALLPTRASYNSSLMLLAGVSRTIMPQ